MSVLPISNLTNVYIIQIFYIDIWEFSLNIQNNSMQDSETFNLRRLTEASF